MPDLYLLDNQQIVDLYEIKLSDFEGYFYFHGSKNFKKNLVFGGITYLYIPSEMSNLSYDSEGKQNRPIIKISNANNLMSSLISSRGDLLGKDFHRKKVLSKDLDAVNFGGSDKNLIGSPTGMKYLSDDKFIINKKNHDSKEKIEFELSNILDIDGLTCPSRKVYNNHCPWQYRGAGCHYGKDFNYKGPNVNIKPKSTIEVTESLKKLIGEDYASLEGNLSIDGRNLYSNLISWHHPGSFVTKTTNTGVDLFSYNFIDRNGNRRVDHFFGVERWDNEASTINSTGSALPSDTFYFNFNKNNNMPSVRENYIPYMGGYFGVGLVRRDFSINNQPGAIPAYWVEGNNNSSPRSFAGQNLTIIYVVQHDWITDQRRNPYTAGFSDYKPTGGYMSRALTTNDGNTYIGYSGGRFTITNTSVSEQTNSMRDSFRVAGSNVVNGSVSGNINSRKVNIYSAVIPGNESGDSNLMYFSNGSLVYSQRPSYGGGDHNITYLGFNQNAKWASHIVLYEMIIFNEVLSESEVKGVNAYLSRKYNVPVEQSDYDTQTTKMSEDFFPGIGNLGVPVADENDKLFFNEVSTEGPFAYRNSYKVEDLTYKGDYDNTIAYAKGDFVKIDPDINYDFSKDSMNKDSEMPSRFFVCISENGSKGLNPLDRSDIWVEDKCSKKLSGCYTRFRGSQPLPFGGFPGTVSYDYELPQQ